MQSFARVKSVGGEGWWPVQGALARALRPGPSGPSIGGPISAQAMDGLSAVGQDLWDELLCPGNDVVSYSYLDAWEQAELPGFRSRPIVARSPGGDSLVAASPGYWYDLDLAGTRVPAAAKALSVVRRAFPRLLMARTYELGSPTPLSSPFLVARTVDAPTAVRALAQAALREADEGGAQFMLIQNLTSLEGPIAGELERLGFAGIPIPPTAVVDLCYSDFDEYLKSMRSQYRRRAKLAFERSAELDVEHLDDFEEIAGQLAHLWRLVYSRADEVKREVLTPAFFRRMSRLDGSSVLLLRRKDRSIASFALLFAEKPWLSFLHCGFDEAAGRTEGAYFRLLYEIVRAGIEGGYQQVELGLTTMEPKMDVGAVPVPLYGFIRHRNPVLHKAVSAMARGPLSEKVPDPRRVFKEECASAAELVQRRQLVLEAD